jgi:hypothetical protein
MLEGVLVDETIEALVLCQKGLPLRHEKFAIGLSRDHEWFPGTLHRP